MIVITWLLVGAVLALASSYIWWKSRYWATKGVSTPPCLPIFGHFLKMAIPQSRYDFEAEVYEKHGGSKFCGIYYFMYKPGLLVGDPELLRHIFVKDFDYFTDRQAFKMNSKKDRVLMNMLSLKNGEEWKSLRSVMSPTFTSGKMKNMFPLVCKKADDLVSFCLKEAKGKSSIDMKYNFGRFTMDTIAACAFGIECNSLVDEKPIFAERVEEFFSVNYSFIFKLAFSTLFPWIADALGVRVSVKALDFFEEVATATLAARRKGEKRGDFLDLLLEAEVSNGVAEEASVPYTDTMSSQSKKGLDDLIIVSQSVLFLVAGYDTTASTLAFASYFLAKNPDVQNHLRHEIKNLVKEEGDITYQGIMEAKYLDSVLMETLRLYPPGLFLERKCVKEYKLPGTDVTVEPGTVVVCPLRNIQLDPKYWPEPEKFRPERFLPENRSSINSFTHMPFGMGPRNCLAMRFALMEAKIAIAKVLLASEITLDPGFELKVEMGLGIQRPGNGVKLVLKPLKEG